MASVTEKIFILNWFLIMSTLLLVSGESQQISVITRPTVSLRKDTTGYLPCLFQRDAFAVYWKKGENPSTAQILVFIDLSINVGERSGQGYDDGYFNITDDYTLVINIVASQDDGRYFCEASDKATGKVFRNHTDVTVFDPLYTVPDVTVTTGSRADMPCDFLGKYTRVYWVKELQDNRSTEEIIIDTNAYIADERFTWNDEFSLSIYDVTISDEGNFTCHVWKTDGTMLKNSTVLTVHAIAEKPYIRFLQCDRYIADEQERRHCAHDVMITNGRTHFQVDCSVYGVKPIPSFSWSETGTKSDIEITLRHSKRLDGAYDATAIMTSPIYAVGSVGEFLCTVEGEAVGGHVENTISVYFITGHVVDGLGIALAVVFIFLGIISITACFTLIYIKKRGKLPKDADVADAAATVWQTAASTVEYRICVGHEGTSEISQKDFVQAVAPFTESSPGTATHYLILLHEWYDRNTAEKMSYLADLQDQTTLRENKWGGGLIYCLPIRFYFSDSSSITAAREFIFNFIQQRTNFGHKFRIIHPKMNDKEATEMKRTIKRLRNLPSTSVLESKMLHYTEDGPDSDDTEEDELESDGQLRQNEDGITCDELFEELAQIVLRNKSKIR